MRKYLLLVVILSGCAATQNNVQMSSTNHPLMSMSVDCRYGAQMVNELEYIISNPQFINPIWQTTFATVAGNQTAQQRTVSAKSVLWNIRTQCQGF